MKRGYDHTQIQGATEYAQSEREGKAGGGVRDGRGRANGQRDRREGRGKRIDT